jgi:ABC-type polysaccharide/polyol phosphate transport system, ATPase component
MEQKNSIELVNVTKNYKVYTSPKRRLAYSLTKMPKFAPTIFAAVNNVSFTVKKGEIIGIIGRNGAGKSTILKLITGVSFPTSGQLNVNGRISSLLELGAGFNMELTGMENIFFQADIMGIPKEVMQTRVANILEFANIGDFINQPVKNYSSGMFARLAFATAINVDPDILIVDEVLAVGDIAFQFKCIEKMKEFAKEGVTIIFVTHSMMSLYRFCDRAIWIKDGAVIMDGDVEVVVPRYEDDIKRNSSGSEEKQGITSEFININSFEIKANKKQTQAITLGESFDFLVDYTLLQDLAEEPYFAISIVKDGLTYDAFSIFPSQERYTLEKAKGRYELKITFHKPMLNISSYEIYFAILEKNGISQLYFGRACAFEVVGNLNTLGLIDIEHETSLKKIKDV